MRDDRFDRPVFFVARKVDFDYSDMNRLTFRHFIPLQGDLPSARDFSSDEDVLPGRYVNALRRRGTELRVCGLGLHGDEQRCFHRRRGRGRRRGTSLAVSVCFCFPRSVGRLSSPHALRAKDRRGREKERPKEREGEDTDKREGRDLRFGRFPRDHLDCL